MLDRATESAADASEIGSMSTMLLLDAAIETLVKAACTEIGEDIKSEELHAYLEKLAQRSDLIRGSLGAAKRLRKARNNVQHGALPLRASAVRRYVDQATAFAALVVREVLHEELSSVSVATLVTDPQARTALDRACTARNEKRFGDALLWACLVFENLCGRWELANRRALGSYDLPFGVGSTELSRLQTYMRPLVPCSMLLPTFTVFAERLPLLMMGFSPDELTAIFELIRRIEAATHLIPPGAPIDLSVQPHEVDFVVEVVARQAWRLEAAHPGTFGPAAHDAYVAFVAKIGPQLPEACPVALPGQAAAE